MQTRKYAVGIVGATGLVGREIIAILEHSPIQISALNLFASERTAGEIIDFKGKSILVRELKREFLKGHDILFFSSGSEISKQYCLYAVEMGAVVIDNSSEFRMDQHVPLVVPEVNPDKIKAGPGIIANPNCSTIQLVVALKPLHDYARLKRIVVSTYQSVSGVGKEATDELFDQVRDILTCQDIEPQVFSQQIAFNIIPHIDFFHDNRYSNEEMKMARETAKIFDDQSIKVTATCARVPTFIGHCEAVNAEFYKPITVEKAHSLLKNSPAVLLLDDPQKSSYPTPIKSVGRNEVMVGRVRKDETVPHGLNMWIVADNLRKGAALNAVQIAEKWITYDSTETAIKHGSGTIKPSKHQRSARPGH